MYVKITMAMTADGKTADEKGHWYPLCPYERERFYNSLSWADAVVVGAETVVHADISFLPPGRKAFPLRVVLDSSLRLNPSYKVFDIRKAPTLLLTSCSSFDKKPGLISEFRERGVEVSCLGNEEASIPPHKVIQELSERGLENILIVGGGRTNWFFIKDDLVNEYQITITPHILGESPYTPVKGGGLVFPGKKLFLYKIEACPCGQEVVLYYKFFRENK